MDIQAKQVVSTLVASKGASGQKAKVKFVVDHSVSIKKLTDDGTLQAMFERLLPIGMILDDNGEIETFVMEDNTVKLPQAANESNYAGYISRLVSDRDYGGTIYSKAIKAILADTGCTTSKQITYLKKNTGLKSLFGSKAKEVKGNIMVDSTGKNAIPTLCFFLTDGDCDPHDVAETMKVMFNDAPKYPVFFQFIGLKSANANYGLLNKLDKQGEGMFDVAERFIDNANFVELSVQDFIGKTNEQFYPTVLNEFLTKWLPTAKEQFLIK